VVQAGDTAIYMLHDEIGSMLSIDPAAEQKIGRRRYSVKPLIGAPYGSVFEMQSRSLELVGDEYEILGSVPEVATDISVISGDNSKFNDSNTAQKLKDTDIHRMRDEGASGNEIIRSLIQNSESWNSKTQFAQQKWLARKQKRYVRRMRVVRCTPHTLCDTYHAKSADKIR
jgi:tRNA (adenine-N(1)-)-methyltransferase non-catalytic subunit